MELTHFNEQRRARMVDVTDKPITAREAVAEGFIAMRADTLAMVREGRAKKGDMDRLVKLALPGHVLDLPRHTNVHQRDALLVAVAANWLHLSKTRRSAWGAHSVRAST